MLEYIDTSYTPGKKDLVVEYHAVPQGISLQKLCEHLAGESSIGTWTDIATMNPAIAKQLKPKVFSINQKTHEIKIAYTEELFEEGNMPVILSSIAGNVFGMKVVKYLRLQDISFPKSIVNSFPGPRYGIHGVRKLLRVKHRPLVGTIVKPKVGLTAKQHAKVAYESWVGGLDIVKDDENLGSMVFNRFNDRVGETLKLRDKAEQETGEKKMYMANVTAESDEMLRRAEYVHENGGEYVMIDILTAGWSALQTLRNHVPQVIHAHRAMHGALTRLPYQGISMLALAKVARLCGADQLHIGTAHVGKMEGSALQTKIIEDEISQIQIKRNETMHVLEQDWYSIKPMFPVASGGLSPLSVPPLLERMGKNIIAQMGGGVHGHPQGTRKGARAARQAIEAAMHKIPLKEYAQAHPELSEAIKKWG